MRPEAGDQVVGNMMAPPGAVKTQQGQCWQGAEERDSENVEGQTLAGC